MADKGTPRSIRFPKELWAAIDQDARSCNRSSLKQIETILSLYYNFDTSEISAGRVQQIKTAINATAGVSAERQHTATKRTGKLVENKSEKKKDKNGASNGK